MWVPSEIEKASQVFQAWGSDLETLGAAWLNVAGSDRKDDLRWLMNIFPDFQHSTFVGSGFSHVSSSRNAQTKPREFSLDDCMADKEIRVTSSIRGIPVITVYAPIDLTDGTPVCFVTEINATRILRALTSVGGVSLNGIVREDGELVLPIEGWEANTLASLDVGPIDYRFWLSKRWLRQESVDDEPYWVSLFGVSGPLRHERTIKAPLRITWYSLRGIQMHRAGIWIDDTTLSRIFRGCFAPLVVCIVSLIAAVLWWLRTRGRRRIADKPDGA